MRIISFSNQKGGVGKTTSTANVGGALASLGKKVLLIDIDPQANLTKGLGFNPNDLELNIYHVLLKRVPINDVWLAIDDYIDTKKGKPATSNLWLVPANKMLSSGAIELEISKDIYQRKLYNALIPVINADIFDFILIDCPPNLGSLTMNALCASNEIIIPLEPEFYALEGIEPLLELMNLIQEELKMDLHVSGVVATRYIEQNLHQDVVKVLKADFKELCFKTVIRKNVSLGEAPSNGKDIFRYKKDSNGAEDYMKLTKEIMARG